MREPLSGDKVVDLAAMPGIAIEKLGDAAGTTQNVANDLRWMFWS